MSPEVWWALFGVPLFVMAVAWVGLSSGWSEEVNRTLMTIAMFFPTAATLIGCCALAYVQLGGRVHSGNELVVYGCGFIFDFDRCRFGLRRRTEVSALVLCAGPWSVSLDVVLVRPDHVSGGLTVDKS
jgi:hypothetical protein